MARISATERRADFVKAAVKVIAAHGIDGATTRRIAEEAGAPLATLHYCYHSKEELFADVYQFVAGRFQDVLTANGPQATVHATARQLLRSLMDSYLESTEFTAATLELVNWATRQHGDRAIGIYDKALEASRSVLEAAASERPLDSETVDQLVYVAAILADGFALNWLTYGDRSAASEQMEITMSVFDAWLTSRLEPELLLR